MQNDEKKVARLQRKISQLELNLDQHDDLSTQLARLVNDKNQQIIQLQYDNEQLDQLRNTLAYLYAIYSQKLSYLEEHYPQIVKSAYWDHDQAQIIRNYKSLTLLDLRILN